MKTESHLSRDKRDAAVARGPGLLWWVAHAIAGFGIGGLFLAWGLTTFANGQTWIPLGWHRRLALEGGAATLFGWAMVAACAGMIAHGFLTCFDRLKHRAESGAKLAALAALALVIVALLAQLIG